MQRKILTEFLFCCYICCYLRYIESKWKFAPQLFDKKLENGCLDNRNFL